MLLAQCSCAVVCPEPTALQRLLLPWRVQQQSSYDPLRSLSGAWVTGEPQPAAHEGAWRPPIIGASVLPCHCWDELLEFQFTSPFMGNDKNSGYSLGSFVSAPSEIQSTDGKGQQSLAPGGRWWRGLLGESFLLVVLLADSPHIAQAGLKLIDSRDLGSWDYRHI